MRRDIIEQIMCHLSVDLEKVAAEYGANSAPLLADAQVLARFETDGLVVIDDTRITVTESGRPFVRNVAAVFDTYLAMPSEKPRHAAAV